MKYKFLRKSIITISILIIIIQYYYEDIYRTNFKEFTNININNIDKLEISILYYDNKPSDEFEIGDKEKIEQMMNILNKYELKRKIFREKLSELGINLSYTYSCNSDKKPNRATYIVIYEGNKFIEIKLFLNRYMFIWSDKVHPYNFEIVDEEYEINSIRDLCIDDE